MQTTYHYKFKTPYELFGEQIYFLLVENFSKTHFVGGSVRNMLLQKRISDIDIATNAVPKKIISVLQKNNINYNAAYKNFGIIIACKNNFQIEIATFRKDAYNNSRYPAVTFLQSREQDSLRRDFTINALYYAHKQKVIYDYHNGLADLQAKQIQFIGTARKKIVEDPLRIVRAYRFMAELKFTCDAKTKTTLQNNLNLLNTISQNKITKEIKKIISVRMQNKLLQVMHKIT